MNECNVLLAIREFSVRFDYFGVGRSEIEIDTTVSAD